MFKTNTKNLLVAAALATAAAASPAWAASLSLNPSTSTVAVGNSFDIDVLVSGLSAAEQLAAFDFQINFNPAVLSFSSYSLGTGLGSVALGDAFDLSQGNLGSGAVHLGEVSFLWDLSSQAKSFTLGTLHFGAAALGSSSLSFSNVTLGNAIGNPIAASLNTATVAAVPEPATWALMAAGLGLLGLRRRRA